MTNPRDRSWPRIVAALPALMARQLDGATVIAVRGDRETLQIVLRWENDDDRPRGAPLAEFFVELTNATRETTGLALELWIRPNLGPALNVAHRGSA